MDPATGNIYYVSGSLKKADLPSELKRYLLATA